jgi:hypothetical protein
MIRVLVMGVAADEEGRLEPRTIGGPHVPGDVGCECMTG